MSNELEITTMCAVIEGNKVLMINRVNSWKGWAFPGGHVEYGESVSECIKREMFEETGVVIENLRFKGIANIYNTVNHKRHIIFNYVSEKYSGIVKTSCNEGEIRWVSIPEIDMLSLAEGMKYRIPLFFMDNIQELFVEWDEVHGYTNIKYFDV